MKGFSGLDVYKDIVYLCTLHENGAKIEELFAPLTQALNRFYETLILHKAKTVTIGVTTSTSTGSVCNGRNKF